MEIYQRLTIFLMKQLKIVILQKVLINYKIVNLDVIKSYDESFIDDSDIIFNKRTRRKLNTNTSINIRFSCSKRIAKGNILAENDTEYLFKDNLIFHQI